VAVWITIWEMAFRLFAGEESYGFKPPSEVLRTLFEGLLSGHYLKGLGASLMRVAYGYVAALVIGTTLGLLIAYTRFFEWLIGPLLLGIQSLPSICWLPVAVLWFGLNEKAILFVVLMGSVGSIAMATADGLRQVPLAYQRVALTFGASWLQRLLWVSIPSALPMFVSGLKQAWSFAWRSLLAGELIWHTVGVGGLLQDARDLTDYAGVFAVMILIVCVSLLMDRVIFSYLEHRIRTRWGVR